MNKKKKVLSLVSLLLAVLLSLDLIWMGNRLERETPDVPRSEEVASLYPEMVDSSMKDTESDEKEEKESEEETEEEEEEKEDEQEEDTPEPPENLISSEILKAETTDDLPDENQSGSESSDGDKTSDEEGEGEKKPGGDQEGQGSSEKENEKKEDPKKPDKGDEEEKELQILTDLGSYKNVEIGSLSNDKLQFSASLLNADEKTELQVWYTPVGKSKRLLSSDSDEYEATLIQCTRAGQRNRFSLIAVKDGKELLKQDYFVTYAYKEADEDNPSTGSGVTIEILNPSIPAGNPYETSNQNVTVTIRATSNESGKKIYADTIQVYLNGKLLKNTPTGNENGYEYQLYLDRGYSGDYHDNTLAIRAKDPDNTANSGYISRTIRFHGIEDGEVIGTGYVQVDASTVGWGPIDEPWPVEIRQGQPASYAVLEALTNNGIEVSYSGTLDNGFYIRGLNLGDCSGLEPDEILWKLIDKDGLNRTGSYPGAVLGEHHFTQGSGWMYSAGGTLYSGKGLSGYFMSPGETIYLRYTVAYGKDIGASSGQGTLSTYCCSWINGVRSESHVAGTTEIKKQATCTEEGEEESTCSYCGTKLSGQAIPALGHDYVEISRTEATSDAPGEIVRECSRCHDRQVEEIPQLPPVDPPVDPVDPDPPVDPSPEEPTDPVNSD